MHKKIYLFKMKVNLFLGKNPYKQLSDFIQKVVLSGFNIEKSVDLHLHYGNTYIFFKSSLYSCTEIFISLNISLIKGRANTLPL